MQVLKLTPSQKSALAQLVAASKLPKPKTVAKALDTVVVALAALAKADETRLWEISTKVFDQADREAYRARTRLNDALMAIKRNDKKVAKLRAAHKAALAHYKAVDQDTDEVYDARHAVRKLFHAAVKRASKTAQYSMFDTMAD